MNIDEVICPSCGCILDANTVSSCFKCDKMLYPWQKKIEEFFESNKEFSVFLIIFAVIVFITASLMQGYLYIPFSNGFCTDVAGIILPFFLFYFIVLLIRNLDNGIRFIWPGKPFSWKLVLISFFNLMIYLAFAGLLVFLYLKFGIGNGAMGDSVSSSVQWSSGAPMIDIGNGAVLLGLPELIYLLLIGSFFEVMKIFQRICPCAGFPDLL